MKQNNEKYILYEKKDINCLECPSYSTNWIKIGEFQKSAIKIYKKSKLKKITANKDRIRYYWREELKNGRN